MEYVVTRSKFVTQHVVFALEPDPVEAPCNRVQYLIGTERLQNEVHGSGSQCLDRRLKIGKGGHQDRIGEETDRALLGQPVDTALSRHDVVKNDDIEVIGVKLAGRDFGIGGFFDVLAAWAERAHKKVAHAGLVIDHQNRCLREPRSEFRIDQGLPIFSRRFPRTQFLGQ